MYIAFPVLLYTGERIFRAVRSGYYDVKILKVPKTLLSNLIYTSELLIIFRRIQAFAAKVTCKLILLKKMQATAYPGKVLHLSFSKPDSFAYRGGMCIFVQCPQISPFEW